MRRSYEFKQESYIVEDNTPWNNNNYRSFYVPPPLTNHNMHVKSSYDHHDDVHDMIFNDNPRVYHDDHDVKKNEHHAMASKTTLLRPPRGSVNKPNHQYHHQATRFDVGRKSYSHVDEEHDDVGSNTFPRSRPLRVGSSNVPSHQYHDRDTVDNGGHRVAKASHGGARVVEYCGDDLEDLVKRIEGEGRRIEKIEVIEYESKRYVPGAYHELREFGVRPIAPIRSDKHRFIPSYAKPSSWFKGF